jgi:hypothetical protein
MEESYMNALGEAEIVLHQSGTSYACTLRGIFKGMLHVVSAQPIPHSAYLTLSFGETIIAGTVQSCRRTNDFFLLRILVDSPAGARRRAPRMPVNQGCVLTALGHEHAVKVPGMITDISSSGMGLRMPQRLKIGTMICVQTEHFLAAGYLLHCRYLNDGVFAAGIEITDMLWGEKMSDKSWSRRTLDWFKSTWRAATKQLSS